VPESVARARRLLDQFLSGAGVALETRFDAVVVAGELLANAVTHGSRPGDHIEFDYAVGSGAIDLCVRDCARRRSVPVPLTADEQRPSGRGLQIVDRLAVWSERIVGGRREVRARIAIRDRPDPRDDGAVSRDESDGRETPIEFADRAARNEEVFRSVNERIEEGGERHGIESPMPFHCECDSSACFDRVEILPRDYRRVVDERYHFVVVPGHDDPRIERVVEEHDTYSVVEKIGEAREALDRQHPQQRHQP